MKKIWKQMGILSAAVFTALSLGLPISGVSAKEKVILDADMVDLFDDGVAMMMLAESPEVELKGVTVVFGNTWVETGAASAIRQLEEIGREDIPVYLGVNETTREGRFAGMAEEKKEFGRHFDSHLGAAGYDKPTSWRAEYEKHYGATPAMAPSGERASDFIIKTIKGNPGEITLVVIGTAANLAEALEKAPEIAPMVKRVVYMAGTFFEQGNVMPHAEFNVWADPESAKKVYRAPWTEQIFLPLDVCHKEKMDHDDFLDLDTRIHTDHFRRIWENHYATPHFRADPAYTNYIWDVLAAAVAIDESIITEEETLPIDVNDQYGLGYGETLAFRGYGPEGTQKVRIVYSVDRPRIWEMVRGVFDKL